MSWGAENWEAFTCNRYHVFMRSLVAILSSSRCVTNHAFYVKILRAKYLVSEVSGLAPGIGESDERGPC